MIYPTVYTLGKGTHDRYSVTIGVAKAARLVTDEYTKQREEAEKKIGTKDSKQENDKNLFSMISEELRDNKAIKTAIDRISDGVYEIVDPSLEAEAEVAVEAEPAEATENN